MTSNERQIIKCLWEAKGKAHIQLIARETGLSQDYARILGRSLERAGYIKFADMNLCHLLTKGCARFQDNASVVDNAPEVVVASVVVPAISVGDDIVAEDSVPKEAEDLPQVNLASTADDSDLDKALAEVGVSDPFQKNETVSEKIEEISEAPKETLRDPTGQAETSPQSIVEEPSPSASSEFPASAGVAINIEPQVVAEEKPKESEVIQAEKQAQAVSMELPQVAEKKVAASSESPEKVAPKEEPVKPSGFGWNFKKIVDWFTAKK